MKLGNQFLSSVCLMLALSLAPAAAHSYSYRITAFANMEMLMRFDIPNGSAGNIDWHLHVYDEHAHTSLGAHGDNWNQRAKLLVDKSVELPWANPLFGMTLWEINTVFADEKFPVTQLRLDPDIAEQVILVSAPKLSETRDKGLLQTTVASRRSGESTYHLSVISMYKGLIRSDSRADGSFLPKLEAPYKSPENSAILYFFRVERI